jgi:HAMP domain-containing protein
MTKFKWLSISLLFILIPSSGLLLSIFQIPQAAQGKAIAIISASLLINIISIYYFLLREIIRPLRKIVNLAKKVSLGERSEDFPILSNEEIGELGMALNRLKISQEISSDIIQFQMKS